MKCLMCNANVRPKITEKGIKTCPKCDSILGVKNRPTVVVDKPKEVLGKYKPHLVCSSLGQAVARVREYGVLKYHGENGWKQQTIMDYMDALGRHYDSCRNDPEARDLESGLLHIAQIAANAMFILQKLKEQGADLDSFIVPTEVK